MNIFQSQNVNNNSKNVSLYNIQNLYAYLDEIILKSDEILLKNLFEESKVLIQQTEEPSKTYQEKAEIFSRLTESWFKVWNHYKHIPEAVELIETIDHITNYLLGYYHLFLSLSLINEGKSGEDLRDSERVVLGFQELAETIDIFGNLFSEEELKQIQTQAKHIISISNREKKEYFEEDAKKNNSITQLRAYCSLILLKVEEQFSNRETESKITQVGDKTEVAGSPPSDGGACGDRSGAVKEASQPWWEKIVGTFADDSIYDEAMRLGREYRQSVSPDYNLTEKENL